MYFATFTPLEHQLLYFYYSAEQADPIMVLFNYMKDDLGIKEFVQAFLGKHHKMFNKAVDLPKAIDMIKERINAMMSKKGHRRITPAKPYRELGTEAVLNSLIFEGDQCGLIRGYALDILTQCGSIGTQTSQQVCSVSVDMPRLHSLVELTAHE